MPSPSDFQLFLHRALRLVATGPLCVGLHVYASDAVDAASDAASIPVSESLQSQAERPMRWIIENSKIERRKEEVQSPKAAPAPTAKAKTKATSPRTTSVPSDDDRSGIREMVTPIYAEPASRPASPAAQTAAVERLPAATTDDDTGRVDAAVARARRDEAAETLAARRRVPAADAVAVAELAVSESLVPLSQDTPPVWRGLCQDRCAKSFYRVAFTVLPDGSVDNVRIVETNFSRLRNVVMETVAKWKYRPIATARDEEVVIRPATF